MKKETIITSITLVVLIAVFALGIYFIVRLVNGPGNKKEQVPFDYAQGKKTYTHPDYGFSFDYPADFKIGKFPEGDGEIILVQDSTPSTDSAPRQGSGQAGFQIFISKYDELEELSFDIIKKATQDSTLGELEKGPTLNRTRSDLESGKEIQTFSFEMKGEDGKNTHEIWFVQNGNLYQVTSYKEFGDKMEEIIKTIRFN